MRQSTNGEQSCWRGCSILSLLMLECSFHNGLKCAATNVEMTNGKAWRGNHYFASELSMVLQKSLSYFSSSVQMPRNPHKTFCGLSLSSFTRPMRRCSGIAQYWQERLSWLSNYPLYLLLCNFSDVNSLKASDCTQPVQVYKNVQILKTPAGCYNSKPCESTVDLRRRRLHLHREISFFILKHMCKCISILTLCLYSDRLCLKCIEGSIVFNFIYLLVNTLLSWTPSVVRWLLWWRC